MNSSIKFALVAILALASAVFAGPTSTIDVPLGDSGWMVSGPSFYELNVSVDGEGDDWVAITISKNFYFGPDPLTGLYPGIELNFSQIDGVALEDLATRVIIQSEGIYNGTNTDWTDYHWKLYQHGIASFNRDLTNPTTDINEDGWFIGPFSEFSWEESVALNVEQLNVSEGIVADGETYFPGTGSGSMVIDLDFVGAQLPGNAVFQFIQVPTPEPTTVLLLAGGSIALIRRRRIA